MSLHGALRINGRLLGAWSARNTGDTDAEGTLYRCEAVDGLPGSDPVVFDVRHHAEDGATVLAIAVLTAALAHGFVAVEPSPEQRHRDALVRLLADDLDETTGRAAREGRTRKTGRATRARARF